MKNVARQLGSPSKVDNLTDEDTSALRCLDCDLNFTSEHFLLAHLFHHVRQPRVVVKRYQPPLKLTFKSKSGNSFEIINSPTSEPPRSPFFIAAGNGDRTDVKLENFDETENSSRSETAENAHGIDDDKSEETVAADEILEESSTLSEMTESDFEKVAEDIGPLDGLDGTDLTSDITADLNFPSNLSDSDINSFLPSPVSAVSGGDDRDNDHFNDTTSDYGTADNNEDSCGSKTPSITEQDLSATNSSESSNYGCVPGAEPTPPPDPHPQPQPSPDYPKIRIKTTGLLKEPMQSSGCTITEITDDNPNGDPTVSQGTHLWTTPSLEDPLKLPDGDDNILSLFNNNDRAKDFGFTTSNDNEYISLDRLDDRNRNALQLYNSNSAGQNPLDSLTGLPMQALAQQVSRLQPSGNGMQQNVLINIQQFPQAPPQSSYQPPMYHPGPHAGQPMYHNYPYQPPNHVYYPPAPGYPQHMPPPPQPQMNQIGQPPMSQSQLPQPPMNQPQMNQSPMMPNNNNQQNVQPNMQQGQPYRQPMPPRQLGPRPMMPAQRMPNGNRQPMGQRPPTAIRQRAPMPRPRGGGPISPMRGVRPRMPNASLPVRSPIKRTPDQIQGLQAKKKRLDILTPGKDDEDCQVICMQPKNTDGLPQIASVQGGTSEPAESSIMHLSDSITLSVRNPPPKPASPKKSSDAKAVADILATRGITVTASAKPKEKQEAASTKGPQLPSSLNLNGAVSIIPSAKNGNTKNANGQDSQLPTVDLTDDSTPSPPPIKQSNSPQKSNQRPGLPYRCDLCPAQYPNALGLSKHRQNYHKTTGGMCEMGIPVINLKLPGILQKMAQLGVNNYIPLPSSGPDGTFALPVISARNPGNVAALGANTMLSLGPIRSIPRPQTNNNAMKASPQK